MLSELDEIDAIQNLLNDHKPHHWTIETQAERKRTGESMTQALRMNLRALSSLSLLVAAFLVFQALDSSVAKRNKEIATLHSIGSPRWLTKALWLSESLVIGVIGGGLGIVLGNNLGKLATGMVSQTVNTLYYFSADALTQHSTSSAIATWGFVIASCVVAGWWPAKQAALIPPAQLLKQDSKIQNYRPNRYRNIILSCIGFSIFGYLLPPIQAPSGHAIPIGGYLLSVSLVGLVVALAVLTLAHLGKVTPIASKYDFSAKIGISQLRTPVTRHRLALGGVTIAVGMTAAMIILIASFESTVRNWIGGVLQADVFIRSKAAGSLHSDAKVDPDTLIDLFLDPRIKDASSVHTNPIRINGLYTKLIGYDYRYCFQYKTLTWINAPKDEPTTSANGNAIISESFQERFDKNVGDAITLDFPSSRVEFIIVGTYADYGNEQGAIGISKHQYLELTGDTLATGIAIHLKNEKDIAQFVKDSKASHPSLSIVTNRWLRNETMRIFNRVFSVTYALELVGLFISVAGLGSMIFSLMLERRNEVGAQRMIGIAQKNSRKAAIWEACSIATLGSLFGTLLGFLLGFVLIFIINKQSFGWTLSFTIPPFQLGILSAGVIMSGAIVSNFVSKWILQHPIDREE